MRAIVRRLTEWIRRALSDMDGKAGRPSERERASQTPYKIRSNCRAFVSNAFVDLNPRKHRRWFADNMSVGQSPPLCICE